MDGTGLQTIEDKSIAQRIRDKVNDFNRNTAIIVFAATAYYMVLPLGKNPPLG